MDDITVKETSFKTLSYSIASTLYPYIKLDGFAEEGVQWEEIEKATFRLGADGLAAKNSKPVLYTCTMTFLPNSACRNTLDMLALATTPQYGKTLTKNNIVLTVRNELTGTATVYSGGEIVSTNAGDSANLNDGQSNKTYKFCFSSKAILPM